MNRLPGSHTVRDHACHLKLTHCRHAPATKSTLSMLLTAPGTHQASAFGHHPCVIAASTLLPSTPTGIASIAANDKHHVQAPQVDAPHNLFDVGTASRGTLRRASWPHSVHRSHRVQVTRRASRPRSIQVTQSAVQRSAMQAGLAVLFLTNCCNMRIDRG